MDYRTNRGLSRGKSKTLQVKSEQLQKENNEMEQRIIALRQMMQKEREERERLGGSRWKSSITAQEKQQTAPKSAKKQSNMKGQPKFKILSDKPVDTYLKKAVDISRADRNAALCGQCENVKAKLECVECGEIYCPPCFKQFHSKGAMRKHGWQQIDQERPTSASTEAFNFRSSSRQRVSAPDLPKFSPKAAQSTDKPNLEREESDVKPGGLLLEGSYDEQESAASFQEALREWRSQPSTLTAQKDGLWVNPTADLKTDSKSCDTEDNVGVQANTETVPDIKLTFNSSLSYADRLMLKKHRKSPESTISYNRPRQKESKTPRVPSKTSNTKPESVSPRISNSPRKSNMQNGIKNDSFSSQQKSMTGNDSTYPNILQIQLLPSDDDDAKYGSSDLDSSSPIVNYAIDEGPTVRTDRRTLSQMGRLAIVELSFSDPENDISKNRDSNSSSGLTSHSPLSFKRAASGLKSPCNDTHASIPHSPNSPANNYVTRQKILMEKKKKRNNVQVCSATKSKKNSKQAERKWQPSNKYVGLNSFFMVGVEKENVDSGAPNCELTSQSSSEIIDYTKIGRGMPDSWRQNSSLSKPEESAATTTSTMNPKKHSKVRSKEGALDMNKKVVGGKALSKNFSSSDITSSSNQGFSTPRIVTTSNTLTVSPNTDTPRVSMTDFDFLSALPPASKGDDLLKLHRASTVTLFALSPQPPDIWNDESEIDIPVEVQTTVEEEETNNAPQERGAKGTSSVSESARKEIDRDDTLALEALSKEIVENSNRGSGKVHARGSSYHWEDDSLSIEDNDDGSGLTSSADGEESDDLNSRDFDNGH